jgi:hypothetical protein
MLSTGGTFLGGNPCSPDRSVDGQGGRGLSSGAERVPEWVVAIASSNIAGRRNFACDRRLPLRILVLVMLGVAIDLAAGLRREMALQPQR